MTDSDDIITDFFNLCRLVIGDLIQETDETKLKNLMRDKWGGNEIYIRKKENESRAVQIRKEFNGRNRLELQQKYGISKGQFYRDIKGD